jgi:hypothetical protein
VFKAVKDSGRITSRNREHDEKAYGAIYVHVSAAEKSAFVI